MKAIIKIAVMYILTFAVKMVSERKMYKGVFRILASI